MFTAPKRRLFIVFAIHYLEYSFKIYFFELISFPKLIAFQTFRSHRCSAKKSLTFLKHFTNPWNCFHTGTQDTTNSKKQAFEF